MLVVSWRLIRQEGYLECHHLLSCREFEVSLFEIRPEHLIAVGTITRSISIAEAIMASDTVRGGWQYPDGSKKAVIAKHRPPPLPPPSKKRGNRMWVWITAGRQGGGQALVREWLGLHACMYIRSERHMLGISSRTVGLPGDGEGYTRGGGGRRWRPPLVAAGAGDGNGWHAWIRDAR